MLSVISSKAKAIWKKMFSKEYRDAFVASYNSGTIAGQISAMRQARGWTQTQLADKCGMRQPRISALEDPDFENVELVTLQRIASACDVALMVAFVPFSQVVSKSTSLKNSDFNIIAFSNDSPSPYGARSAAPSYVIAINAIGHDNMLYFGQYSSNAADNIANNIELFKTLPVSGNERWVASASC